jgi:hypothetical protein
MPKRLIALGLASNGAEPDEPVRQLLGHLSGGEPLACAANGIAGEDSLPDRRPAGI